MVMTATSKDLSLKEPRWELVPSGGTVVLEGSAIAGGEQLHLNLAQRGWAYYVPAIRWIRKCPYELPISSIEVFAPAPDEDFVSFTFDELVRPDESLEHEVVVKMPPKRRYSTLLEIRNVTRAQPNVVEP